MATHPGAATRRRGTKLEAAILEAAWDELTEVGYPALTMEGVAARAKTSRAVLYRRWPNRPELMVAALGHHAAVTPIGVPDTGTLRGDLLVLLRHMSARVGEVAGERAVERGEIDPARLSPRIRSLPVDIVRHDLIMNQQPLPQATLVEIVDKIFLPLVTA